MSDTIVNREVLIREIDKNLELAFQRGYVNGRRSGLRDALEAAPRRVSEVGAVLLLDYWSRDINALIEKEKDAKNPSQSKDVATTFLRTR